MSLIEHTGPARLGKRTKELVRRLDPDDIAVIDHTDLDRVSAEELVESGVRVVVNVAPSQSGRYPNPGPLQLVRGGVRLIDVDDAEPVRGALGRRAAHRSRRQPLPERDLPRHRPSARGARARRSAARAAGPRHRGAAGVRRQHAPLPPRRGQAAHRGNRLSGARDELPRPARARRRPRARAQARPEDRARLRPRLPAGARRRRRRRRGPRRGGLEARRDRRRHGLGHRRDPALRRRDPRPCLPRGLRARRGAAAAARRAVSHGGGARDLRGHRAPARARQGR